MVNSKSWNIIIINLTGKDVSRVADEPVCPIENESLGRARMRPEISHERLDESQTGRDAADQSVPIVRLSRPAVDFDEDDNKADYSQQPAASHQTLMRLRSFN